MINTTPDYLSAIAFSIAQKKVNVTPYFGPVQLLKRDPRGPTLEKRFQGLDAYNYSNWEDANENAEINQNNYVSQFEIWWLPAGVTIDTTNCASVPSLFRGSFPANNTNPFIMTLNNGTITTIDTKNAYFIPKGTTITAFDSSTMLFTGIRAFYSHLRDTSDSSNHFTLVTNDVYIGNIYYNYEGDMRGTPAAQGDRCGFVDPQTGRSISLNHTSVLISSETGALPFFGVFNAFGSVGFATTNLEAAFWNSSFPRYENCVPYILGWRFPLLVNDGSNTPYLTQALTP